ncbi:DUF1328 domain-containing protein [Gillisia sp. M10.2A]|uniref:DUF1328 domain-containing protein n=1 Tax=Gillisia lutea TaxID=2909668 RepID=A0ABS9EGS9_9FLAO|nr:DUF1328 domain-containing protein [Gillisia lutea]MCF4102066.1 DUF1328 domain-containing protein [Gillisia lutea]
MKNYTLLFLIMTVVTGLIGFAGLNFYGIEVVRVLFLIFADLLVISVISKLFFPTTDDMRLQRVKK